MLYKLLTLFCLRLGDTVHPRMMIADQKMPGGNALSRKAKDEIRRPLWATSDFFNMRMIISRTPVNWIRSLKTKLIGIYWKSGHCLKMSTVNIAREILTTGGNLKLLRFDKRFLCAER